MLEAEQVTRLQSEGLETALGKLDARSRGNRLMTQSLRVFAPCGMLGYGIPAVLMALAVSPDLALWVALLYVAVQQAEADDEVHVIVLAGAGRAFCAGYDLQDFGSGRTELARALFGADYLTPTEVESIQIAGSKPARAVARR